MEGKDSEEEEDVVFGRKERKKGAAGQQQQQTTAISGTTTKTIASHSEPTSDSFPAAKLLLFSRDLSQDLLYLKESQLTQVILEMKRGNRESRSRGEQEEISLSFFCLFFSLLSFL